MKKTDFSFTATDEMAPSSHVIVYYITSDGEIISDKLKFELESDLKNPIDIHLSASQVKPSADLNITINTKEDSFVGLLGVDQSVLVMRKGNDIEKSRVMEELKEYNKGFIFNRYHDSYKDFVDADALIITNVVYIQKKVPTTTNKPVVTTITQQTTLRANLQKTHRPFYLANQQTTERTISRMLSGDPPVRFYNNRISGTLDVQSHSISSDSHEISYTSFSANNFQHQSLHSLNGYKEVLSTTTQRSSKINQENFETEPIEVRKEFPETWLFNSFELSQK